jgi:outer membrane protein assembly factor BamB
MRFMATRRTLVSLLCVGLLLPAVEASASSDWPQPFHDAGLTNHNGDETDLTARRLQRMHEVRTLEVPGYVTGFVVAGDAVFVTWVVRSSPTSPAISGGVARYGLDGVPVWSHDDPCDLSDPAVVGGSLLYRSYQTIGCPGPPDPPIIAVDAATGVEERWSAPLLWFLPAGDRVFATTATMTDRDGYLETSLRAVDPLTGAPSWNLPIDPPTTTYVQPVAASGSLFVKKDRDILEALDAVTGERVWVKHMRSQGSWRTLAAADGRLFIERSQSFLIPDPAVRLVAMSTSTGATLWARRLGPEIGTLGPNLIGSVSLFPRAVVLTQAASVRALDPATGAPLWHRDFAGVSQMSGAGRFAFAEVWPFGGPPVLQVFSAFTGLRVARIPVPPADLIFASGRMFWADGTTIHIWR